jgi:hypothetical protein
LEVNALPSLEPGGSTFSAAAREGLDYDATLNAVVASAARRQGLMVPQVGRRKRQPEPLRIGFSYNVKRVDSKGGDDTEAEYDAPETINSIRDALESYGHVVVPLEATAELPRQLMDAPVDLVFNIAEGVSGRNREAAVPALCELMGIRLHRLGCRDAFHRPRQGPVEACVAPARHPDPGVPGHGNRARATARPR